MKMRILWKLCWVMTVVCVFPCGVADAASTVYDGVAPFGAADIPGGFFSGFDVTSSGEIVGLEDNRINLYSASGVFERTVATVPDYHGWGTFCRLSPDETEVWAGYTVGGNTDDRIYSVAFSGGVPTHQATLNGNYDLEWRKVGDVWKPFVSGLNSSTWSDPNAVWLLDTSGSNAHQEIAEVGGYGSGIAFDSLGNLYAMNQTAQVLYRFAASDVETALSGGPCLVTTDNDFWTAMHLAGSDVTTDGADHVFFNSNDPLGSGASLVSMLQPGYADAYKYDNIATGTGTYGNWSTQLAFGGGTGDVLLGQGAVFVADYWSGGGVTELAVPEPASVLLVSAALVVLASARRRRMN